MSQGLSEPLSNPGDAIVDIVFIHGLQGDRKGTWSTFNTFWPRDLLPEAIPQARILSWGYDSKVTHFWASSSHNEIDHHSSNLCADLASLRNSTATSRRPIIFVAHSLGGIVCANALLLAGNTPELHVQEIGNHTRGIAFLGTPFEGSDNAKWAKTGSRFLMLFKNANDAISTDLRDESTKLSDVGEAFLNLLRRRGESEDGGSKIEVTCFFEEKRTKILGVAGLETLVSRESASLSGYETLSIPANHQKMCKFQDSEEIGYQRVISVLLRWTKSVAESVEEKNHE